MDSSEVGRFGTLRLMKRMEPHKVVASYPVDEEEVTFGRDPSCSIRLYYEAVSALHCKLIFRERKAFLVVLGTNGLLIDGCPVFPATGPGGSSTTVPLPNNSSIEINKKCFQFSYPPKELRQTLIDTPTRPDELTPDKKRRRRTLRMSMIHSAQVFTPRPSQDPRENLRILKTPIKTPFSKADRRQSSPLKRGVYIPEEDEEEEEEEDIVLVETNHPRVVEEDRDLVILEQVTVEVPEPEPLAQRITQFPIPQHAQPQVPQTPTRRRAHPRASLHRAVLIRSAQRTAMKIEIEKEEEQDAEEVEESIQALEGLMEDEEGEDENEGDDEMEMEQEQEAEAKQAATPQRATPVSGWRKSLGLVTGWALRSPAVDAPEEDREEHNKVHEETPVETPIPEPDDEEEEGPMEAEQEPAETYRPRRAVIPPRSPRRGPQLGSFMTPQVSRVGPRSHVRYSVGGFTPGGIHGSPVAPLPALPVAATGARRVRVVEPWRVDDIMIPTTGAGDDEEEEQEEEAEYEEEQEDVGEMSMHVRSVTNSPSKRPQVSEEERKAILERRRSALTAPDAFFGGHVPGSRRMSLFPPASPLKSPVKSSRPIPAPSFITEEPARSHSTALPERDTAGDLDAEQEEDANVMLAKMKQMVEGVKRRQSMGPRPSAAIGITPTPKKAGFSLLAPDADNAPIRRIEVSGSQDDEQHEDQAEADDDDVSDKENDGQPAEAAFEELLDDAENVYAGAEEQQDEDEDEDENVPRRHDRIEVQRDEAGTPSFKGIREMFSTRRQLETPRMDGMRELFREERVMATPSFDGLEEMLEPPAGWKDATAEEKPATQPIPKVPVRRGVPRPVGTALGKAPLRRFAPRTTVSAKIVPADPPPAGEAEGSSSKAVPVAARVVAARKAKAKAAESEPEQEEAESARPVRRTRKASASPAPETTTAEKSTRRGRKTPTPTPEDPPANGGISTRRRAKTPTLPEVEEEADDDAGAAGSKVRRSARGKLTLEVKEEDEEDSTALSDKQESVPAAAARGPRGRKPAASSLPRSSSTNRSVKTATTSTAKKAPFGTAAKGASNHPVTGNKENTPEPQSTPEDEQPARSAAVTTTAKSGVKAKVTRSGGRTRAASEDVVEKEPPAAARVSRAKARK